EVWFKGAKEMTFHDPLAAALIFNPSLCTTRKGTVEALADIDEKKGGMTLLKEGPGPHSAAETVIPVAIIYDYFKVFKLLILAFIVVLRVFALPPKHSASDQHQNRTQHKMWRHRFMQ